MENNLKKEIEKTLAKTENMNETEKAKAREKVFAKMKKLNKGKNLNEGDEIFVIVVSDENGPQYAIDENGRKMYFIEHKSN